MKDTLHRSNNKSDGSGNIFVFTGFSGGGKDEIIRRLFKHNAFKLKFNPKRLTTYTDRPPRPGEKHGIDYHFVTKNEFTSLEEKGHFVETFTDYKDSRKATPYKPFNEILERKLSVIWRIDPLRAAQVAEGEFYKSVFDAQQAAFLHTKTLSFFISVSPHILKNRIQKREGKYFDDNKFLDRLRRDEEVFSKHSHKYHHIVNNDGNVNETVEQIYTIISTKFKSPEVI